MEETFSRKYFQKQLNLGIMMKSKFALMVILVLNVSLAYSIKEERENRNEDKVKRWYEGMKESLDFRRQPWPPAYPKAAKSETENDAMKLGLLSRRQPWPHAYTKSKTENDAMKRSLDFRRQPWPPNYLTAAKSKTENDAMKRSLLSRRQPWPPKV